MDDDHAISPNVAHPLAIAAIHATAHRQLFTALQKRISSFISVRSAHRLLATVPPCRWAEGYHTVVSFMLNPSSFRSICTFHLHAPLMPGSMYKNVTGRMLKMHAAAKMYALRCALDPAV